MAQQQRTYLPLESLNLLQIILHSWISCRICSNNASCCLFSFWKNVNRFFILFVVSSLIQFLNASNLSFSFSINMSCCFCASRNWLSKPRIFSRHSVPSSPFSDTFFQLWTSVRICTYIEDKIAFTCRARNIKVIKKKFKKVLPQFGSGTEEPLFQRLQKNHNLKFEGINTCLGNFQGLLVNKCRKKLVTMTISKLSYSM